MSAAKFTPGPWTIRETPESDYTDFAIHIGPDYIGVYKESDAHLIAAAPELYEALETLIADCLSYSAWERPCHAIDIAEHALKKARGES